MATVFALLLACHSFVASFRTVGAGGFEALLPLDVITQIVMSVSLLHDLAQSILSFMIGCSKILFGHGVIVFLQPLLGKADNASVYRHELICHSMYVGSDVVE